MATATSSAEVRELTSDQYHATPDIGNSMLSTFRRSRREYHARFIAKTIEPEASDPMKLGTVAHSAILEPHIIERVCLEIPAEVLSKSGSKAGKAWKDFEAEHADRILLKADQLVHVRGMFEAVYRNPMARRLLEADGPTEESIFWTCRDTGLNRKCRPDKQPLINGRRYEVDVKTCIDSSERGFATAIARFGYQRQRPYYRDGVKALHGVDVASAFIVVQSEPPYVCRPYDLDERATAYGEVTVHDDLVSLADCIERDDWREPGEDEVTTLSLPNWAFYQDDWRE